MSSLTKEDLGYLFEVALLIFECADEEYLKKYSIPEKHIKLGNELLEFIKYKSEKINETIKVNEPIKKIKNG